MLFNITQLIALLGLFIWIASKFTKSRIVFYSVVTIFAFLLTLQASSVYLINQPFGYQYWINVNHDDIRIYIFQFYAELVYAGIFLILVFILLDYLTKKISTYQNTYWVKHQWATPIFCIAFLGMPNGVFQATLDLLEVQFAKVETVKQALTRVGINPEEYIFPDQLKAMAGKNIVVISMESLEKGFLNKYYSDEDITPSLNILISQSNYLDMKQSGGSWTVGSLYLALTGIPPFFKSPDNGNYIFQNISAINFTTLGEVLKTAGYDARYLMSNANFAGSKYLLRANHFQVVTDADGENLGEFKTPNDFDLFSEAKKQIDQLANKKQPFALFLSTMNSHFPNGIYDPRMENLIKKKKSDFKNEIDYSIMSTDYLVGDFISYLKKKKLLENTVFFIYPDHKMMGNGAHINKLNLLERNLYVITNANLPEKTLTQDDIPRLIIDGSGIKSNAKFLSDFRTKNLKNISSVSTLNESILIDKNYKNSINIEIKDKFIYLASSNTNINKEKLNHDSKWINYVFNQDMQLMHVIQGSDNFKPFDGAKLLLQPIQLTVFLEKSYIVKHYLGNYKNIGIFDVLEKNTRKLHINHSTVSKIHLENKNTFRNLKYESNNQIGLINAVMLRPSNNFIEATSSEYVTNGLLKTKIRVNDYFFPIARGINLLYWSKKEFNFKNYDIFYNIEITNQLINKLYELKKDKIPFVMVGHDNLSTGWAEYQSKLSNIDFPLLGSLSGRVAYIGYSDGINIKEHFDPKTITKMIPFDVSILNWKPSEKISLDNYLRDKTRFIAHAGGAINEFTYTNSLDALDASYAAGLRLFELDIIETIDKKYVAAHDWIYWAKITDYKGSLPPTHEVFMQQKIFKKFRPLDMSTINAWFRAHPDAILVTDKLNEPKKFANQFVDKKRLMMELFSIEAVIEGIETGILDPMPTDSLWPIIYSNHRDLIESKKIRYIAGSRNIDRLALAQIQNLGLRIYAYHINFEKKATEQWVACNERNLFFGMYVDNTNFFNSIKCE